MVRQGFDFLPCGSYLIFLHVILISVKPEGASVIFKWKEGSGVFEETVTLLSVVKVDKDR